MKFTLLILVSAVLVSQCYASLPQQQEPAPAAPAPAPAPAPAITPLLPPLPVPQPVPLPMNPFVGPLGLGLGGLGLMGPFGLGLGGLGLLGPLGLRGNFNFLHLIFLKKFGKSFIILFFKKGFGFNPLWRNPLGRRSAEGNLNFQF
jgi:hypothetical protein